MIKKSLAMVSALTITCLYGLLAAVIILLCLLFDGSVLNGIYASIFVLILQFLIGPWITDLSMKLFYKVNFKYEVPDYLEAFINDVCTEYGMKHPKIGFINDGAPNAFTYGRFRNDARIIITKGITDLLDEDEVKAVVGHELGHVVHRDMLVMTVAQVVPLVLYAIYEMCMDAMSDTTSSDSENNKNGGFVLGAVGIIAYILYIICQLIILWLSRTREYFADEFSCEKTKNPWGLANALVTIGYGLATTGKTETDNKHGVSSPSTLGISDSNYSKEMAIFCTSKDIDTTRKDIQNAMRWDMWNLWAKYYELLSTHPLIAKRLLAISDLCPEYGQERYITFDLEKPESYTDDFVKELFIDSMPAYGFIGALILTFVFSDVYFLHPLFFAIAWVLCLLKFLYKHPIKGLTTPHTVRDLLGEVKVSSVTAIPCEVNGRIIGRGNPGCIFNEDFVINDSTGIIMLNYNQPIGALNKLFALFKSPEYFDKTVKVNGWYRRSPVPYIEIKTFEVDGQVKKVWSYGFGKFGISFMIALHILLIFVVLI